MSENMAILVCMECEIALGYGLQYVPSECFECHKKKVLSRKARYE